jgi:hypothetical protein
MEPVLRGDRKKALKKTNLSSRVVGSGSLDEEDRIT